MAWILFNCMVRLPEPCFVLSSATEGVLAGATGVCPQPAEDIGKPSLRVHIVHFGGDDQGIHEGGAVTAARRSGEEPGLSAEGNAAQGANPASLARELSYFKLTHYHAFR